MELERLPSDDPRVSAILGGYERCSRKGVDGKQCPMPGVFKPVLRLAPPEPHPKEVAASAVLGMSVCAIHKDYTTFDALVGDEAWAQIEAGFDKIGAMRPERSRCWIEWLRKGRTT